MGFPSKSIVGVLFILMGFAFLIGCDETVDPVPPPCPECPTIAYEELEDLLFEYQETYNHIDDADRPADFDFTSALTLYQTAYNADNDDTASRFGLAATKLLALSANSQVNAAFDEWKAYLEAHSPFEADVSTKSMGLPLGLPVNSAAMELPFDLVTCSALAPLKAHLAGDEPLVSDVQDILVNVVLPVADDCIELLTPLSSLDDFTFIISPRMQGSVWEDPLELDRVEIMVLLAACKLLKAGIGVAAAYDVQFPSYDAEGMYDGLNQVDGNIGVLLPGGLARMQAVPALFLEAVNIVDDALDVLQAEPLTDPNQDDDIIKIGPDDVDQSDIDRMQAEDLPDIREAFSATGAMRTENWDGDWETPETALKVNLLNFFSSPVADFKDLLPPYDLVIATGEEHDYENNTVSVEVTIPEFVWSSYYSVYYEDGVVTDTYSDGTYPDFLDYCNGVIDAQIAEFEADPTWTGYASFYFSDWNSRPAGLQTIEIWYDYSWGYGVSVPEIHWTAATYADWMDAMPFPTVGGLFPDMADGAELCATFGILEEDWDPVMTFYWYDGNFGYDEPVSPPPPAR